MSFNVVVATPSTGQCKSAFAFSLARLVAYFAQNRVWPEVEQQQMDFLMLEGSGISSNREDMVRDALLKSDMTHLLWIDEDMGFNMDVLHMMAKHRQPIVACNYRMRVPPADFTALRLDKKGRIQTTALSNGLEEAYYTGFGFCLIERRVFESINEPRFMIGFNEVSKKYTTEDHPFFVKARENGYKCYVDHDASKKIWHIGNLNYIWAEDYSSLSTGFSGKDK